MESVFSQDAHHQNILHNLPGVVFRYQRWPDGQDRLLLISDKAKAIWGITAAEAARNNQLIWQRYENQDLAAHHQSIMASAESLSPWRHEWRYHHPDGSLRWHEGRGQPSRMADGSTIWDAIVMDITVQKQSEQRLESTLRQLQERVKEQRCLYAVARLNEQELRPEALLQAAVELIPAGFYTPEATAVCLSYAGRQYLSQALPPGEATLQNTVSIGSEALNLQIFIQPDALRSGQKVYLAEEAELVQALTELLALKLQRQLSQQALQHSHQRYAYLMQASFDAIWDWDLQSDLVTWGSGIESLFGHNRAELPAESSSWSALIHPDERDSVLAGIQDAIESKSTLHWGQQYRLRKADQHYALIEDKGLIVRDPETGEALHMIGAMRDITQAEAEAQRLERAYHIAGIGTWEYHLPSQNVRWSRVTREIHGIAEADFHPDLNAAMAFYLPEDRPQILDAVQQALTQGKPWDLSLRIQTASGETRWVRTLGEAEFVQGQCQRLFGSFIDIHAQKTAALEQQYKARLLKTLTDINQQLLTRQNWNAVLSKCFESIGTSTGADRVYYFEVHDDAARQQKVCSQRLEWNRGTAEPQIDNPELQNVPLQAFAEFMAPLQKNRAFEAQVPVLPEGELRALLQSQAIQSVLVLPIFVRQQFYGFIGLDDCQQPRQWHEDEKRFLQALCYSFSRAIESQLAGRETQQAYFEKVSILESISDGFFTLAPDYTVTYWNKQAEILLRTPKEAVLHKRLWSVFSNAIGSESHQRYDAALQTQQAQHFETYYEDLNSWFEVSVYPSEVGISVYFKDIGARKASEAELNRLNQQLQQHVQALATSNQELEQFAYIASHDLQEPLRMISSFLSQLDKKYGAQLDDKARRYIFFAVDGAQRMRQIILDLLEYSRVSRAEKESLSPVDCNALLSEIQSLLRKNIQETGAQISWHNLPMVTTARGPLRQVLQNLISNSLKYCAPERPPEISIRAEETPDAWIFAVSDNGIGIEAEYFDKIFVIFQRLHSKEAYSGTGLGLAICKKIVENQGGRIWLSSEPGQGSSFYFSIRKEHP